MKRIVSLMLLFTLVLGISNTSILNAKTKPNKKSTLKVIVQNRKESVKIKCKKGKEQIVYYGVVRPKKLKGRSFVLKFNKSVYVSKNKSGDRISIYERGKNIKVKLKTNKINKPLKFSIGFDEDYMQIIIKFTQGKG